MKIDKQSRFVYSRKVTDVMVNSNSLTLLLTAEETYTRRLVEQYLGTNQRLFETDTFGIKIKLFNLGGKMLYNLNFQYAASVKIISCQLMTIVSVLLVMYVQFVFINSLS